MADREKVFDGLKCLADDDACCHSDCPYFDNRITTSCFQRMAQDALELLKEQQETIVSFQSTINKLANALAEKPEVVRCKRDAEWAEMMDIMMRQAREAEEARRDD